MKEILSYSIARAQVAAGEVSETGTEPGIIAKYGNLIFIVAIFALLYFMVIRPQKKKQDAAKNMQDALKAGDKVMTVNGAIGRISQVGDKTIWIKFGNNEPIEYVRAAIAEVIKEDAPEAK